MFAATLVLAVASACMPAVAADENGKVVFALPILDELAESKMMDMLTDVVEVIAEEVDIEVAVTKKVFSHGEDTLDVTREAFEKDGADFGLVFAEDFVRMVPDDEKNPMLRPMAMITFDQRKYMLPCMYVRKADGIESVKELEGKVIGATTAPPVRWLLHQRAGYDGSMFDYFSEVKYMSDFDLEAMIEALLDGDIDVFVVNKSTYRMGKKPPEASEVEALACEEFIANFIIAASSDAPNDLASRVRSLFLKAADHDAFKKFQFMFMAIDGEFVPVEKGDLDLTREIRALADKDKWQDDNDLLYRQVGKND